MSVLSNYVLPCALVCFILQNCELPQKEPPPPALPNIIFLLTDDQRWDALGAMGNEIIQTPNMDQLAENGIMFRNAYVTTSICAVSRASILSGQHARRHGILDFQTPFSAQAWEATYPALLQRAGYFTGFIGKFGVGREKDLPVSKFDYWKGIPGQPVYEQIDSATGKMRHLTAILGEQCLDFLQRAPKGRPFCLSVSFKAPHVQDNDPRQFIYDPVFANLYEWEEIPVPETAAPRYWDQFPEAFKKNNEARHRWHMRFDTPEKFQQSVKGYYRLITGVDVVIGKIRKELVQLNLDQNTIIILMGDNGFYLGEHGMAGKWYGHEESIRIPLIIYDPRLPVSKKGMMPDEMVLNIDVAPTILSMAKVHIPESMQGQDLTSLVNDSLPQWREDFFYEHLFNYDGRIPRLEGVVGKDLKYMNYFEIGFEELFDLEKDPLEKNNLASLSSYEPQLKALRARCSVLRRAAE